MTKEDRLKEALLAAQTASKAKSDFLFNMSHDIRTPMNVIVGYTELMRENLNDPERLSDYLSRMTVAEESLLALIDNVLEMARIESGKLEFHEVLTDARRAEEKLLIMFAEQAKSKQISFEVASDIFHPMIYCDENRTTEVMLNIVSNAIKYTPAGGSVRVGLVQHPGENDNSCRMEFFCKDTGIGMSPEFAAHAFESFSRERNTTQSGIHGTGLGLAITKRLMDIMGGEITIDSEPGQGTLVRAFLPHRLAFDKEPEKGERRSIGVMKELEGKRVLLVEDNLLNRDIMISLLTESGLFVDAAENGRKALEKVEMNPPYHYDLILMDVQMPVMDGYESAGRIRALNCPGRSDLGIVAMTANAFEEDKNMAFSAGMDEHLAKPVDYRVLTETMYRLLSRDK